MTATLFKVDDRGYNLSVDKRATEPNVIGSKLLSVTRNTIEMMWTLAKLSPIDKYWDWHNNCLRYNGFLELAPHALAMSGAHHSYQDKKWQLCEDPTVGLDVAALPRLSASTDSPAAPPSPPTLQSDSLHNPNEVDYSPVSDVNSTGDTVKLRPFRFFGSLAIDTPRTRRATNRPYYS